MRILLVGEYSRLHNSLKEGLTASGHEVILIGNGDNFKNYPVDVRIDHSFHKGLLKKFKIGVYKLTSIDLGSLQVYLKAKRWLKTQDRFDVVQLINESPLVIRASYEKRFIEKLLKLSDKLFLLSTGVDHVNARYMKEGRFKYSIFTPFLEDPKLEKQYLFDLQYLNEIYTDLHEFIYNSFNGVIASDLDYHLPLKEHPKYLGMIPNPINTNKIEYLPLNFDNKIKIFHGINTKSMLKKGNIIFTKALELISEKYKDEIEIITTSNIPYSQYIEYYNECHILLDQVYAYDQGYNALEAMAKGKIVFTGAEQEWLDHYKLAEDTVAINAEPDATKIAKKLDWLIQNPDRMKEISNNASIENSKGFEKQIRDFLSSF